MKADLHIHSTISDGSRTIPEIIDTSCQKGLDAIAITDHDTLAHHKHIPLDCRDCKVKVFAGVEISAIDKKTGIKIHVLGYGIKKPTFIEELTLPLLQKRHENSLKQIEILQKHGMTIDIDKLNKAEGKYIYKQHIMEQLTQTRQVTEMFGDFYHTVFKGGGMCDFDIEYVDVGDAVNAVKDAGGFAVLAHPGRLNIMPLIENLPFDGIEINHPANSESDKKAIREYAAKYNLFLTGGSDHHGKYDARNDDIGDYMAPESAMEFLYA
ncbi:MAG: PHP domain-containing protein [Peptococcaceae bacterium]|nr:PHP domain-containing protein [Peptococcaceae bacterium]